jgi:anti-anti-sigma factor
MGFPQFTTRLDSRNGVASLALVGELDLATVSMLEEQLALPEGDGVDAITLDLRDIPFLDCTALQAFLAAWDARRRTGIDLSLLKRARARDDCSHSLRRSSSWTMRVLSTFSNGSPGANLPGQVGALS